MTWETTFALMVGFLAGFVGLVMGLGAAAGGLG